MKRRIEQLINGIFEYEPEVLEIRPESIRIEAEPDAIVHGSFRLIGGGEKKVKGFLYASNPRLICNPVEFQGIENEIHYQADCSGLAEGTKVEGTISVCSDQGEYALPFEIIVKEQAQDETDYQISDMDMFVRLAREDFQRAYRLFVTPEFRRFLQDKQPKLFSLYEGLRISEFNYQSLEEFLTGAGLKEAMQFTVSAERFEQKKLTGPIQEILQITKNTWGFQKITIESDASFLRPEKKLLTSDEFAGSVYDLSLIIDTNLMHSGKNCARLTLTTCTQKIQVEVFAEKASAKSADRQYHICKIMRKEMERLYVSFRLKKIDITTWVERSVSVINSYRRAGGKDPYADLFLVQLYFADGKKQKAMKILDALESQKNRLSSPEHYGYYLYMTTFFYQEASYVDRVEAEVNRLFLRDKTNWKLLWILLYLQESYLNDENARYEAVAEQFRYGCRSRILYLEAYQILKANPFLMRHLGAFELQLLRFAAKEEILTAEIIRQVASLAVHHGSFDHRLYEILDRGYQMYPSVDLVKAMCLLLMKGEKTEPAYFPWYEKGVESGLRLTGLYEYYMNAMPYLDLLEMPQVIRMYFAYDSSLDYRKRAVIYQRIIENRNEDSQAYNNYRTVMERFALDQLEAVHISDDLAVIYSKFLRKNALTKQTAEKLTRILCMYEITCDRPDMKKVIVHSPCVNGERTATFQAGKALVEIYDPDSIILLEDSQKNRHYADVICSKRRLFDNDDMMVWCVEKASDFPGMVLYFCLQCMKEGMLNYRTLPFFLKACEMNDFSTEFLKTIRGEVLHYYLEHLREESLSEFLDQINYLEYVKVDKAALITLLAEEGKCAEAFELLDTYGAEEIALLQLVRICSRMVLELEFAENAMLTALCHQCFVSGKYDDKLLRYLLLYFEGTVQEMKAVWQAAVQFDLDTMLLEEKIMMMILFTRSETEDTETIFESYRKKLGRKKLCKAYVNLKAYEYFVKGLPVAAPVFKYIEQEYQYLKNRKRLDEQEEVCRLALLQYYANKVELSSERRICTEEILEEFGARGMRFDFWKRFDKELLIPYQMEGRVFAEYVGNPESKVTISYRIRGREESFTTEDVQNYFEGIFVREFILFYGEELECYLEETINEEVKRTDKRILRPDTEYDGHISRYALLNQISRNQEQRNTKAVQEDLESFLTMEHLAQEVFTLV